MMPSKIFPPSGGNVFFQSRQPDREVSLSQPDQQKYSPPPEAGGIFFPEGWQANREVNLSWT